MQYSVHYPNVGFSMSELNSGPSRPASSSQSLSQQASVKELAHIYQNHKDQVYTLALRLCGNTSDAEDILQEVFLRVYKSIHQFRGDSALSTWLYRLTVNATRSFIKKQQRLSQKPELPEQVLDASKLPGDPVMRRHLLKALSQLPQGYREVLVLHDIQGLLHEEIAEILNIRKGTSKSQLHKARNRMRTLLKGMRP